MGAEKHDWHAIRTAYVTRSGVVTLRDLVREFNVPFSTIGKRCTKEGWVDLRARHCSDVATRARATIATDQARESAASEKEWRRTTAAQLEEVSRLVLDRFRAGTPVVEEDSNGLKRLLEPVKGSLRDYLNIKLAEGQLRGVLSSSEGAQQISERFEELARACGFEDAPSPVQPTAKEPGELPKVAEVSLN